MIALRVLLLIQDVKASHAWPQFLPNKMHLGVSRSYWSPGSVQDPLKVLVPSEAVAQILCSFDCSSLIGPVKSEYNYAWGVIEPTYR